MNLSDKSGVSIQSAALMRSEFFGPTPGSVGVQRNGTIENAHKCRLGETDDTTMATQRGQ